MKNIYVPHANSFDFKNELYKPIRESDLNSKFIFTLPHENSEKLFNSKEYLKRCDLVLAEVSYPSTGLGIELGWANSYGVPIICISKLGSKPSNSLKAVGSEFLEYKDSEDMISRISELLLNFE